MVVGACAGSTSGGMKVTRFIILKENSHSLNKKSGKSAKCIFG